jgi:hypothetical protein
MSIKEHNGHTERTCQEGKNVATKDKMLGLDQDVKQHQRIKATARLI